jgi:Sulfotransferase domain
MMSNLMRFRYAAARSHLRAPLIWLRHWGLDSSDVFLASYARSGSTLLRFQLAEALTGASCSFDDIQYLVPEIGIQVKAKLLLRNQGRLIKTHEPYRRKYDRAIYIVRDVRDVLLSAFAREKAFNLLTTRTLDEYIEPFMQGKMTRFGPWHEHVEGWLNSRAARMGKLLVLRYEEMRLDAPRSLARALQFLGVELDNASIERICVSNSIENMRPKEDRSRKLPKPSGEDGRQVGKGAVQGWRGRLTDDQLKMIDHYAGLTLRRLGYPAGSDALAARTNPAQGPQLNPINIDWHESMKPAEPGAPITADAGYSNGSTNTLVFALRQHKKAMGGMVADYFSWYRY